MYFGAAKSLRFKIHVVLGEFLLNLLYQNLELWNLYIINLNYQHLKLYFLYEITI